MFISENRSSYQTMLKALGCDESEEHIVVCAEEIAVIGISQQEKGFLEKNTAVILMECQGEQTKLHSVRDDKTFYAETETVMKHTYFSNEIQEMYNDGNAVKSYYHSLNTDTDTFENISFLCIAGAFLSAFLSGFFSMIYACGFEGSIIGVKLMQAAVWVLLPILILIPAALHMQNETEKRKKIRQEGMDILKLHYMEMEEKAAEIALRKEAEHERNDCIHGRKVQLSKETVQLRMCSGRQV